MKLAIFTIILFIVSFLGGFFVKDFFSGKTELTQEIIPEPLRPLDKYTVENLSNVTPVKSDIVLEETLLEEGKFTSRLFSFKFDPTLRHASSSDLKRVTGLINLPISVNPNQKFPLVLMIRGFVDQSIYETGMGSKRAGEYFAQKGFITISPDFLGYGASDSESANIFETRFQTYTTALVLLKSLESIESWDGENVFIWAHSNGGQVALTLLEITREEIPTVLWAPVSKPFPYSILYYTDESQDGGKFIRRELSNFEDLYDTDLYSIHKYYNRINAPIQVHQGTLDDAIPVEWSENLVKNLRNEESKKENFTESQVEYFVYPGTDHNLNPSWNIAVERSLNFFKTKISN